MNTNNNGGSSYTTLSYYKYIEFDKMSEILNNQHFTAKLIAMNITVEQLTSGAKEMHLVNKFLNITIIKAKK